MDFMHKNIEIKARSDNPKKIRNILESRNAIFIGTDHQVDTYFKTNTGRLKLREGNIENRLIYYSRPDQKGPKQSDVILYQSTNPELLKRLLEKSLSVLTVVDKTREIYFIDNVKFHLDEVNGLGSFVEIEAIDAEDKIPVEELNRQCQHFLNLFEITEDELVEESYSDLRMKFETRN